MISAPVCSRSGWSTINLTRFHAENRSLFLRHGGLRFKSQSRGPPRTQSSRMEHLAKSYMAKLDEKVNLRVQKRLNPKGVKFCAGVPPSLLPQIDEGLKGVLHRRQRTLDKIFLENVTEILATNPIGDVLTSMGVQITQTAVSRDCHFLHIYYICDRFQAESVLKELNKYKETLRFLLSQKYIMGKLPTIVFMFDIVDEQSSELANRLTNLDLGPKIEEEDHKPSDSDDFKVPRPDVKMMKLPLPKRARSLAPFDPEYAFKQGENPYENMKEPDPNLRFSHPPDMRQDIFSLDYKAMVNQILFQLPRTRSPSQSFNPSSEPLPPVDWTSVKPMSHIPLDANDSAQNFRGRVMLMRQFLIENRKKKQLLAREAKKAKETSDLQAANNLNTALENIGFTGPDSSADHPIDEMNEDLYQQLYDSDSQANQTNE